jgi:hypothetical protein
LGSVVPLDRTTAGPRRRPEPISRSAGELAFEELRAEIEAVPKQATERLRIDVCRAAAIAHGIARRDAAPQRARVLAALASLGYCRVDGCERLEKLALAAWFARLRQKDALAVASEARLPEPVLHEARRRRARMARVLTHWLGNDANVSALLAAIDDSPGHLRLANDLATLAELYRDPAVRDAIAVDRVHFRSDDAALASQDVETILRALGLPPRSEARTWTDLTERVWVLLVRTYAEHRRCGMFAFVNTEDVEATYPSLTTAARAKARRG